jgi:hypothetical protein
MPVQIEMFMLILFLVITLFTAGIGSQLQRVDISSAKGGDGNE